MHNVCISRSFSIKCTYIRIFSVPMKHVEVALLKV